MGTQKIAFITGITGQDGGYLAELLLSKGYAVHGLVRWDAVDGTERLRALGVLNRCTLHWGELADPCALAHLFQELRPDEIYNLAALSDVPVSFLTPAAALDVNAKGTLHVLEAVRLAGLAGPQGAAVYQASSSEMFGDSPPPQDEGTPFAPCSPYGVAKLAGYWMARVYREAHGLRASNGILFNHESPLRGEGFVTRKIARAAAARAPVVLGNLEARRDWGHARDYVAGMWAMLQRAQGDDYVLATGQAHTVRMAVERAYTHAGIEITWEGAGADEVGRCAASGRSIVTIDPMLFRPKEVPALLGNAAKAREVLGWAPKIGFDSLMAEMVDSECAALPQEV